jgi:hypothetical protein
MTLDDKIFDRNFLTRAWTSHFLSGDDEGEGEVDPQVLAAQYLLFDLQRLGATDEGQTECFLAFRDNLERLANCRPYPIDIDRFEEVLKNQLTAIVPAMRNAMEDLPIETWLNVYMRLSPQIPERLGVSMRIEGENDECLGGFASPVNGSRTIGGRISRLAGFHKAPTHDDVSNVLEEILHLTGASAHKPTAAVQKVAWGR